MTADQVLAAWCEWDDRPGAEREAGLLVDAVAAFATELGCSSVQIRRAMAAGRRCHKTRDTVLAELIADLSRPEPDGGNR